MEKEKTKVAIAKIETYDKQQIKSFLSEQFDQQTISKRLQSVETVLLKPNLLGAHKPEAGVTTHPLVVEAIIEILLERGKKVLLGDSPGGTVDIEHVWQVTGIKAIADKYPIELLNFGKKGIERIEKGEFTLYVDSRVFKAEAIINIAKFKTHSLTKFTGAVKNLYGTIPGLIKSDYHRYYPNPDKLAEMIVALYSQLKARLVINVIDGIVGMEGEGPSAGKPRNFGVMLASPSASALDFVAAGMMGYESMDVPLVRLSLAEDSLNPEEIEVTVGWEGFVFKNVKIGVTSISSAVVNRIPKPLRRLFFHLYNYYPAFDKSCRLCRVCEKSCPVEAITIDDGAILPVIDFDKCIKCMCCHELCPYKAVYLKKTFLAKLIMGS